MERYFVNSAPRQNEFGVRIVFAYWLRTVLLRTISMDELREIVVKFVVDQVQFRYELHSLKQWDSQRCDPRLTLSNGNKTVTVTSDGDGSVFSKCIIRAMDRTVRWEVMMKEKGGNGIMSMGVIDAKHIDSADVGTRIGDQHHQIAFEIWNDAHPLIYINGKRDYLNLEKPTEFGGYEIHGWMDWTEHRYPYKRRKYWHLCCTGQSFFKTVNWNIGDRVKLEFSKYGCEAYLNDESLGVLTDDLPETFFFAISPYDEGTVLETTLFQIL